MTTSTVLQQVKIVLSLDSPGCLTSGTGCWRQQHLPVGQHWSLLPHQGATGDYNSTLFYAKYIITKKNHQKNQSQSVMKLKNSNCDETKLKF